MFSALDLSDLPYGSLGYPFGILCFILSFFLKKQRIDDSHELAIVDKLMDRIDKVEKRSDKVEAEARAARAETAEVRGLHVECVEENAKLRVLIGDLRTDVQRLQERAG